MYEMSCFVKIKGRAKNGAIWIMGDPMSHCGIKLMNYLLTIQYKLRMLTFNNSLMYQQQKLAPQNKKQNSKGFK